MSYKGLSEHLVARISPLDARHYAAASGWVRQHARNGKVAIFSHSSSDLDQLLIPLDAGAPDYERRMAEVVWNLAEREGRPAGEILNDLLLPPSDILRFRLSEPAAEPGTLPLEQGIHLLLGAKKALLSAACSVVQPQTFHPRLSRTETEALVASSRMGQTERGSFTVTIACPLGVVGSPTETMPLLAPLAADEPPSDESVNASGTTPFPRQVTTVLMRSVGRVAGAIDSDDMMSLSHGDGDTPPLSANLCDALLMMQPDGERSRLTIAASWSRAMPRPSSERTPSSVELRGEYFPAIAGLAQSLRPAQEPRATYLVGLVDFLGGDPGQDGRVQGDVQRVCHLILAHIR